MGKVENPRDLNWSSVPRRMLEGRADPWQEIDKAAGSITQELEARVGVKPAEKA